MSSLQQVFIFVVFLCLCAVPVGLSKQEILQRPPAPTPPRTDLPLGTHGTQVKTFRLRYMLHHGGERFPGLLRRLDIDENKLRMHELASGVSFTHTIRAVPGKTMRPRSEAAAEEFQRLSREGGINIFTDYYEERDQQLPHVRDVETLVSLAKMTYDAYIPENNSDWYDLGERYNMSHGFGWESDGLRGYVFTDSEDEISIVAIKGTSLPFFGGGDTVPKDKKMDNLMFSCCCARVGPSWTPICDCYRGNNTCGLSCLQGSVDEVDVYYNAARNLVKFHARKFSNKPIWIVGHSLGGSLSALVGVVYGQAVVAFEAPGERLLAERLHLPRPPGYPFEKMNIWHFGHTADPIFMGACTGFGSSCWLAGYAMETKCHLGRTSIYDTVERLGWSLDIRRHKIQDVIETILPHPEWSDVPEAKVEDDCEDCGLWEWVER